MAGKGRPKTGGRAKGVTNKVTQEFRETVRKLLEENSENVGIWLAQVAQNDPDKALDKLVKLAEFAAPKLNRTEVSGPDGGAIAIQHQPDEYVQSRISELLGKAGTVGVAGGSGETPESA